MSLFLIYNKIFLVRNDSEPKKKFNPNKIAIPALLDVIATIFANSGLIYVKNLNFRLMFLYIKC